MSEQAVKQVQNSLVDRLREPNRNQLPDWPGDLLEEAADEIERLHQMLREARAGFDSISNFYGGPRWDLAERIDAVVETKNPSQGGA